MAECRNCGGYVNEYTDLQCCEDCGKAWEPLWFEIMMNTIFSIAMLGMFVGMPISIIGMAFKWW